MLFALNWRYLKGISAVTARFLQAVFPAALISVISVSCLEKDTDKYDAAEANLRILSMYALRDAECGTSHVLSGFIAGRATRTSVDLCVSQLYMLTCNEWQASDPAPAACKAIGISFR